MFLLPHMPFWFYLLKIYLSSRDIPAVYITLLQVLSLLITAAIFLLLHIRPYWDRSKMAARLKIMYGGHRLLKLCRYGILFQIVFYLFLLLGNFSPFPLLRENLTLCIGDFICCFIYYYLLIVNSCIRILCTCRRLGIIKRLIVIFFLFTPVVNLFLLRYLSKKSKEEFDQELCRFENRKDRDGSFPCATKYPIIMLHGIGFRDFQYLNYWGRIPKELARYGAMVYYGHQEAWGTIEHNASIIQDKIQEILRENQCEKVNIIAHSKGGLDARYLISGLHMEAQVASLTTISTPHRGSELINYLDRLPDSLYRFLASWFDKSFRHIGDQTPDCYHASKQLSPAFCREFNEKYPDAAEVYYQSYATAMKHPLGDSLLTIPYILMRLAGIKENDGLVAVASAKWGVYKETFISTGRRGISHGDIIDLKREDYKGFDVLEAYVKIVRELKEKGY